MNLSIAELTHRGLVCLSGTDKISFLQGLVTNDVKKVSTTHSIYTALLTPQGKFLHDLFITETWTGDWLIECERPEDLLKRLNLYKLRSEVQLTYLRDYTIYAVWGQDLPLGEVGAGDYVIKDPRLPNLGQRWYRSCHDFAVKHVVNLKTYDQHRIVLGVADGSRDIPVDRGIILECNFDELGAIDWQKGCYMGQELTARTRYRGVVRKRMLPVCIKGLLPDFGTVILDQKENPVGEIRTTVKDYGLALLRLSVFKDKTFPLQCSQSLLTPFIPDWMPLNLLSEAEEEEGGF